MSWYAIGSIRTQIKCITSNNVLRMWNLSILLTEVAGSCQIKYTSAILFYVTSTFTNGLLQTSVHFTNLVWTYTLNTYIVDVYPAIYLMWNISVILFFFLLHIPTTSISIDENLKIKISTKCQEAAFHFIAYISYLQNRTVVEVSGRDFFL
jgi:hypothetical protein